MSVGALIGLTILPYIMDNWGRKPSLIFGSLFMLLGVALQSGSINFGMFVAARLILGFGDIIVICTAPLLIAEIAPPQDRAILVTLAGSMYQSGAFIAAWVTYGTLKIEVSRISLMIQAHIVLGSVNGSSMLSVKLVMACAVADPGSLHVVHGWYCLVDP